MEIKKPTHELKSKNESLILFRFLKLGAIFVGAWTGIWFTLLFSLVGGGEDEATICSCMFAILTVRDGVEEYIFI
jgi:hypothetical protein